jgi:hypothetical protein
MFSICFKLSAAVSNWGSAFWKSVFDAFSQIAAEMIF